MTLTSSWSCATQTTPATARPVATGASSPPDALPPSKTYIHRLTAFYSSVRLLLPTFRRLVDFIFLTEGFRDILTVTGAWADSLAVIATPSSGRPGLSCSP